MMFSNIKFCEEVQEYRTLYDNNRADYYNTSIQDFFLVTRDAPSRLFVFVCLPNKRDLSDYHLRRLKI